MFLAIFVLSDAWELSTLRNRYEQRCAERESDSSLDNAPRLQPPSHAHSLTTACYTVSVSVS